MLLSPLLPGHAVGLSLPATLASFLPESMVAGLNLEETNPESENEVTSATSHHTSLDAFLDLGVPVKRPELKSAKSLPSTLKTSASLKPEIQNKKSDIFSDFHSQSGAGCPPHHGAGQVAGGTGAQD